MALNLGENIVDGKISLVLERLVEDLKNALKRNSV